MGLAMAQNLESLSKFASKNFAFNRAQGSKVMQKVNARKPVCGIRAKTD
jgi:hypothetical protein